MKKLLSVVSAFALAACFTSCHCECPEDCECSGSCGSNCSCPHVITVSPLSASPSKFKDGEPVVLSLSVKMNGSVNGNAYKFKAEYYVDDKLVAESDDEANKYSVKVTLRGYAVGAHKLTAKLKGNANYSDDGYYGNSSASSTYGPVTIYVKK